MDENEFFKFLILESKIPFSGWDFSYFYKTQRMDEEPLSWNYTSKILNKISSVKTLLDMGTGGGEFLSLLKPLPPETYATECYDANMSIAEKRLKPLGIKVIRLKNHEDIPFDDNFFDLVINRHDSYSALEIARLLKKNKYFITQQVGSKNNIKLNRDLQSKFKYEELNWNLDKATNDLINKGMKILECKEEFPITRFYDAGAIVYFLKAVSWQVEDFTVDKYFDKLKHIQNEIDKKGYYDINSHRFYIIAEKL